MQDEAICRLVGRRLRLRRRSLDLTQTQVATRCGLSFQQIHQYEVGMVDLPISRLLMLANILGMSLADILGGLPACIGANDDRGSIYSAAVSSLPSAGRSLEIAKA